MQFKAIVAGVIIFLSAGSISAQSPAIDDAVDDWLNGPEVASLQALSKLAYAGNANAQMLLGQIDRDTPPGGYSDYLATMARPDRRALLRSDSSAATKNWLLDLSDPSLAGFGETVFGYRVGRDVIGNAVGMRKHNEVAAAEFVLWQTLIGGRFDLVNTMPAENHGLSKAGFLNWISGYIAGENKAVTMNRLLDDTSPDMISGLLGVKRLARVLGLERNFSDKTLHLIAVMKGKGYDLPDDVNLVSLNANIAQIAQNDPVLNLAVRSCTKCTQEAVDYDCVIQSMEIVGGYEAMRLVRTPVETVIPAAKFIESARALATFENMVKSRSKRYKRPIRSACIADLLQSK